MTGTDAHTAADTAAVIHQPRSRSIVPRLARAAIASIVLGCAAFAGALLLGQHVEDAANTGVVVAIIAFTSVLVGTPGAMLVASA